MSKELEALEYLQDVVYTFDNEQELIDKAFNIVQQALIPPTQEEVCEALSDYLGENVLFDRVIRMFIYYPNKFITTSNKGYNIYSIQMTLPPHLITMIGRFYEGENK